MSPTAEQERTDAVHEMRKSVQCLYLELPKDIADDVRERVERLIVAGAAALAEAEAKLVPELQVGGEGMKKRKAREMWQATAHALHARIVTWAVNSSEDRRFLALAFCGEAGELANIVKKTWRGDVVSYGQIAEELADCRIYLELLARAFEVNLDEACEAKLITVAERWREVLPRRKPRVTGGKGK